MVILSDLSSGSVRGVIHQEVGPAHGLAGMFITALKRACGLFHVVRGKGKVTKVMGVSKLPRQARRGRSIKEAS